MSTRRITAALSAAMAAVSMTVVAPAGATTDAVDHSDPVVIYNQRDLGNYSPGDLVQACGGSLFGSTIPQAWDNRPIFSEFNPETLDTVRQWYPGFLIMSAAVSPDGNYVYVGGSSGIARFNCKQREFDLNRAGQVSTIEGIAVDRKGQYVYGVAKVTDTRSKLVRYTAADLVDTHYYDQSDDELLPDAYFESLAVNSTGTKLYTVSDDNSGDLLDRDRSVVYEIDVSGPQWNITAEQELAFSGFSEITITPDDKYLYTTDSGSLSASEIVQLSTSPLKISIAQSGGGVNGLYPVTTNGRWVYTSGGGNPAVLLRAPVGPSVQWDKRIDLPGSNPGRRSIVVSSDGRTVWQATKDYLVTVKYGLPDNCNGRNRFVYPWLCEQSEVAASTAPGHPTEVWPRLLHAYRNDRISLYFNPNES